MQNADATDMIWGVAYQLADLCRLITPEPGDEMAVEISGLGRLENTVVDWEVDLRGSREQPAISAHALHVALAVPEDQAQQMVQQGRP